jgi:hypothetical protein
MITYQGVFSRVEKPSDDINSPLFLMNKKGMGPFKMFSMGRRYLLTRLLLT